MHIQAMGIHTTQRGLRNRTFCAVVFAVIFASALHSQNKTSATGTCAVAHNGNGDVITINNCGIGRQQADKIVEMLKAVLNNQKENARDQKLDELLVIAKRIANPYGTISTYGPDGIRRDETQSAGATVVDTGALSDFKQLADLSSKKNWQGMLDLAKADGDKYPGWFTPNLAIGFAEMKLCHPDEAKRALNQFLSDSDGAVAFVSMRQDAQKFLGFLDESQYQDYCASKRQ